LSEETEKIEGALLALGDQPHIPVPVIGQVIEEAQRAPTRLIIPSHAMRRGHPFYLPRVLWPELLALGPETTLRRLIDRHSDAIIYVEAGTDAILRDMDTPEEYARLLMPARAL
jgi:molybdenum cofactor cytidylyltransferase